jgi:hypothetical protein
MITISEYGMLLNKCDPTHKDFAPQMLTLFNTYIQYI